MITSLGERRGQWPAPNRQGNLHLGGHGFRVRVLLGKTVLTVRITRNLTRLDPFSATPLSLVSPAREAGLEWSSPHSVLPRVQPFPRLSAWESGVWGRPLREDSSSRGMGARTSSWAESRHRTTHRQSPWGGSEGGKRSPTPMSGWASQTGPG